MEINKNIMSLIYRKFQTFLTLTDYLSSFYNAVGVLLISFIILFPLLVWSEKSRKEKLSSLIYFIIIFLLYSLRAWDDFLLPYLWAEDGSVLISGSIFDGVNNIFKYSNGTYWVIQRTIALLCYWLVLPFNQIQILPVLQGIVTKLIAAFSVFYFTDSRFEWIVKKKINRFYIGVGIILFMPLHSADVLSCDTSLPFLLNFTVFILSLDFMFRKKAAMLSVKETIFMILMALSTAAAPFTAGVAFLAFTRWLIEAKRENALTKKNLLCAGSKLFLITAAAVIQVMCVLSCERVNDGFDIINRLILNMRAFIFFPYWENFHSWTFFILGLIIWLFLMFNSKISWRVILYCAAYSYAFLFYCSMTTDALGFYNSLIQGRYVFLSYEISAFLLGITLCSLLVEKGTLKRLGKLILTGCSFIAIISYPIKVFDAGTIEAYGVNIGLFKQDGKDIIKILIGPDKFWLLTIPAELPSNFIEDINLLSKTMQKSIEDVSPVKISGIIETGGQDYTRLFVKLDKNSYIAAVTLKAKDIAKAEQEYIFLIPPYVFPNSNELEFVGQTADGEYHSAKIDISNL